MAPCSLAVGSGLVVFHDGERLVALERAGGSERWRGEPAPTPRPVPTNTGPRVLVHEGVVLLAAGDGKISACSAETGKQLWKEKQLPGGHQSLKDLFIAGGLVWTGAVASSSMNGEMLGYDPNDGTVKRRLECDVRVHWFHHRCYPMKATDDYILAARNGTEFVDLKTGHWKPHHRVRGGCIYGVMPANGFLYAPMDACACQLEAKLPGIKALSSGPAPEPEPEARGAASRLDGHREEIAPRPVDEQPAEDFHLFCQIGLLDDSYFFRSYWSWGRRVTGGYGSWFQAERILPSGRILCVDTDRVYGYGREPAYMVNASVLEYQLFAADKEVTRERIERLSSANRRIQARSSYRNANSSDWRLRTFFPEEDLSATRLEWTRKEPAFIARALAASAKTLFAAGPPKLVDERRAYRFPDDAAILAAVAEQREAYRGRRGGQLWAVSKSDGAVRGRYQIDSPPVFDGLAAANGKLYLSATDGRLVAFAEKGQPLPALDDRPDRMSWSEPEDPSYPLPPRVSRESDFARVKGCSVVSSKLGYRLRAAGAKKSFALALRRAEHPLTGAVRLRTRLGVVPGGDGRYRNGYLAFGDSPNGKALVKCGVRFRQGQACIVQGPRKGGRAATAEVKTAGVETLDLEVEVDLVANRVRLRAGEVSREAKLERPLDAITWFGYAVDNALMDFAPIAVDRP